MPIRIAGKAYAIERETLHKIAEESTDSASIAAEILEIAD